MGVLAELLTICPGFPGMPMGPGGPGGPGKRQDVLRTEAAYNARKSTISSLLIVTALTPLPSLNPTPYPRPGLNLPMGPGGPGGPAGPWGHWLLVSVKVLNRNGSPGGKKMKNGQGKAGLGRVE